MADPVYTLGIELQTGSFTDVTTRVERGSWGQTIVDMFNPPRVGRAMFELANDDGLMGPRVNSSFQPGRNIQLTVVCSAITYALFYGKVTDVSLRSTLGARTTIIEAEDDWARLQDLRWTTKLYSGTNAKSLFCELMSLTTVRSFQVDAVNITSDHNLALAWYQDSPAVESIYEFVSAGNYQLLVDGAGTYQLRGRNWSRFDASSTPSFDVSSWATAFRSSMSRNSIYNRVRISGLGFLDSTAPSTIVFMPTAIPYFLPPGVAVGFVFNYQSPNDPHSELICGSVIAMVQSQDWYVAANADGTGTDISSNWTLTTSFFAASGVATYTSNSLQGWLARSQARGYPMIPISPVYTQLDVASSQTAFGVRAFSMNNRLLQFQAVDYVRSLATHIASDRKDGMHEAQLTLTNQFWVQYLNDSLGNIIYVIDPFSGAPTTWRTRATTHELEFTQGLRHVTTYELDTPQGPMGWGTPYFLSYGLFVEGQGAARSNVSFKYVYGNDTVARGSNMILARTQHACAGNATVGIFGCGTADAGLTAQTTKYTYSSEVVAAGTSFSTARFTLAAAGESTVGIFGAGIDSLDYTAITSKYTYASDSVGAGTNLSPARSAIGAAGNDTRGIFAAGFNGSGYTAVTDKYTYSGDTRAAGTSLTVARRYLAGVGNITVGIFGGGGAPGAGTTTDKYTYGSDVVAAGTVLGKARFALGAAGTSTLGIFADGQDSVGDETNYTDKYTYSGDTVAPGTALDANLSREYIVGTSSTPGHF